MTETTTPPEQGVEAAPPAGNEPPTPPFDLSETVLKPIFDAISLLNGRIDELEKQVKARRGSATLPNDAPIETLPVELRIELDWLARAVRETARHYGQVSGRALDIDRMISRLTPADLA